MSARQSSRRSRRPSAGRDGWLLSYSVLMTLLFSLFVVLYASSRGKSPAKPSGASEAVAPAESASPHAPRDGETVSGSEPTGGASEGLAKWNALSEGLSIAFGKPFPGATGSDFETRITADGFVVRFMIRDLFQPGRHEIPSHHFLLVDRVAQVLVQHGSPHVRIEGHVNAVELKTMHRDGGSAWELSTLRAVSVAERWMRGAGFPAERISVGGFAIPRAEGQLEVRILKNAEITAK